MGNRQLEYLYGLQELRRAVPNPDPGMHRALDLASVILSGTNEKMIDYIRTCYEEAKARHDQGKGFLPEGRKEIRTVWTWGFTPHMLYLPDWLEEEFGMTYLECGISNLPHEIVGYVNTGSVESMIEGLAWRSFNFPMARTSMGFSDLYVNDLLKVARAYKADAAVFSGHTACKHSWATAKMLGDTLLEDVGIPSFKWETDFLDKRFTPHSVAKTQLAEFFKTLS
ncbi:MAG: 2-hydroxyacyl-CoA dehydratase, partial [Desulfatitalea sp.]|nr:2-hydroxyacyl-CoA dehydratase [Desulfatitalea sp.]